jgi:hypothetical protein
VKFLIKYTDVKWPAPLAKTDKFTKIKTCTNFNKSAIKTIDKLKKHTQLLVNSILSSFNP